MGCVLLVCCVVVVKIKQNIRCGRRREGRKTREIFLSSGALEKRVCRVCGCVWRARRRASGRERETTRRQLSVRLGSVEAASQRRRRPTEESVERRRRVRQKKAGRANRMPGQV